MIRPQLATGEARLAMDDPPRHRMTAAAGASELRNDARLGATLSPPHLREASSIAAAKLSLRHIRRVFSLRGGEAMVALDDVSLDVRPGEFVAILGPSGCGKSTLLQIMAGLMPASAGEVKLDGHAVFGPPPKLIYLFQQYAKSLFPWRSVVRNVEFALQSRGVQRAARRGQALEYLKVVGLDGFADRYPWQLSGGMQQRVAIARALAAEPEVLLLDEPFSAVDALTRLELQALVLDLWSRRKLTVVLVTHDVDEAVFMADRIVMLSGRPAKVTKMREVAITRPRDPITTREDPDFLALRHDLMAELLARPGVNEGGPL
ncbi:MAG TPA: ABC transporter ATP-binding protein [Alphaproteobacteria bacterium]|nr:ABC transporter ATP-binding protein [Alphaproteobacteria bacterium]